MTTATKEIQRLDKFLRMYKSGVGQLVYVIGTTNQSRYSVDVPAHVRNYTAQELTDTIIQGDSLVIISSTQINAVQWPGSQPTPPVPGNDVRVPRRGYKFIWEGTDRNVESCEPFYFEGQLVRLEMQVRGME